MQCSLSISQQNQAFALRPAFDLEYAFYRCAVTWVAAEAENGFSGIGDHAAFFQVMPHATGIEPEALEFLSRSWRCGQRCRHGDYVGLLAFNGAVTDVLAHLRAVEADVIGKLIGPRLCVFHCFAQRGHA